METWRQVLPIKTKNEKEISEVFKRIKELKWWHLVNLCEPNMLETGEIAKTFQLKIKK